MGTAMVLPEVDEKMNVAIKTFMFKPEEIVPFMKIFQKLDREKTGLVKLEDLFKFIEMQRNVYTDQLCELFGIDISGNAKFYFCISAILLQARIKRWDGRNQLL